jgi:hypothetical protein
LTTWCQQYGRWWRRDAQRFTIMIKLIKNEVLRPAAFIYK